MTVVAAALLLFPKAPSSTYQALPVQSESPAELAAATQAHIRQRPHGGAGFDYPTWLSAQFPVRAVKVYTDWIGRGSVGVVVAMKDGVSGRVPTAAEMTEQLNYLGAPGSS